MQVLIDSRNKVNAITLVYVAVLELRIYFTDVKTKKIDGSTLLTYGTMLANFQFEDKQEKIRFFQKIFLVLNIAMKIILEMLFLALSNLEINFAD